MLVSLHEITASTVRQITALAVHDDQIDFVATNAESLAQALFSQEAWYRAIYYDETPVGFVMLYDETLRTDPPENPKNPKVVLWRFMIDADFQGMGIGKAALALVIDYVRSRPNVTALITSYVPAPGCPEFFYLKQGFQHTGKVDDGEVVLELLLDG